MFPLTEESLLVHEGTKLKLIKEKEILYYTHPPTHTEVCLSAIRSMSSFKTTVQLQKQELTVWTILQFNTIQLQNYIAVQKYDFSYSATFTKA